MRHKSAINSVPHLGRPHSIDGLTDSARRGELVAIIGTGVSLSLTNGKIPALSWKGLILDGFAHGVQKGKINSAQTKAWKAQLDSEDLDDLLAAAEFMGRKLDAPRGALYARWLENVFKHVKPANREMEDGLCELHRSGIPLCTLNYDSLLETVTHLPTITLSETARVGAWMRRESQGILHLHGSWDAPDSCILGIRDYETTLGDDVRDLIQRSLGSFRRLLFIGCGETFADPNFSALIAWLRQRMKTAAPEHYALVKNDEVTTRHADPAWQGFVEPLGYGGNHSQLPAFLLKHFSGGARSAARKKKNAAKDISFTSGNVKVIQDYRAFLLRDCGQMTIEGVRADMDTAQRRFDLERLFVPLKVLPSTPDLSEADPERERKLTEWREKNKHPIPFGKVFANHQRIALLALPGGGKTLLLKRLAVAYADTARRKASSDALPNLDLTPVLIRCREWREHIHRPIPTILQNIPDITGQSSLVGLSDALVPLFKKGRILLLVDGLDEIHDDALRTTFVEHLEAFLRDQKLTRLVVTSREAGFSLVAPSLARFCERWRVAPLEPNAVEALCDHWHLLMTGDSPEAQTESQQVTKLLLHNEALRRLAENPLLLTMLLVVKRGAGRLPPDRVSLYGRAVDVLLDTWNIKGHDPLNPKESVPQLAYVAFELMRAGKQTATEKELLTLLEDARDKVPQIRRYAKDTPQEFLRRVELRSSLLVEVGRQVEGGGTVAFYQFRHLTFQEYLAAVATVEGHYLEYDKSDTVLVPLKDHLTDERWKEVIPMSAVLARKQAEPLIVALVEKGNLLRQKLEANQDFPGSTEWAAYPGKLPAPIARLVQCLVEEAEAAPETLTATLQLVALFAKGCRAEHDWRALSRGPYGEELWHQAWFFYACTQWPQEAWLRNTCAALAAYRLPDPHSPNSEVFSELERLLASQNEEDIGRGLLACSGLLWNRGDGPPVTVNKRLLDNVARYIFHAHPMLQNAAIWAWIFIQRSIQAKEVPSPAILDHLVSTWLSRGAEDLVLMAAYALSCQIGLSRSAWTPVLSEEQVRHLQQLPSEKIVSEHQRYALAAACVIAFHAGTVWPEEELARRLVEVRSMDRFGRRGVEAILGQMGATGQKYIKLLLKKERAPQGPGQPDVSAGNSGAD